MPVHQLSNRRSEILQWPTSSLSTFDPRQPEERTLPKGAVEKLHCELLQQNQQCLILDILIPCQNKIMHDHTYALPPSAQVKTNSVHINIIIALHQVW